MYNIPRADFRFEPKGGAKISGGANFCRISSPQQRVFLNTRIVYKMGGAERRRKFVRAFIKIL